ncbi:hypothetical protein P7C71_g231, partial [Lecanoromycetidae sp. Uapishka_2]
MLPHRLRLSRVFFATHPPRSSTSTKQPPKPRLFTQHSQLLLVSRTFPRPQLPFLHPGIAGRYSPAAPRNLLQYQLSRLITTERKLYLKDQIWKGAKYTLYGWAGLALIGIMAFGLQNEILERRFPSPPEWSMISRINFRSAKNQEHPDPNGSGLTDWASAGQAYGLLLERLEDSTKDGQDLQPILQDEGDIYVAGVGKAGLDISSKSEPWRRGYYECLLGCAKAAENRDGWVRDTTRNIAFPAEVVIGPSNPHPKPVPFGAKSAPLEENCVPAFEPAETYYMRILTTHGFSTRQRLDAALAYADWLDFKGLASTAEDMYDWGLDIAMGALPEGVNNVIDIKTGVIDGKATHITSNVLLATTSLAYHHARNNNLAAALPIFLSVLRARRRLPNSAFQSESEPSTRSDSAFAGLMSFTKSLLMAPTYPPAPPTGDEIALRTPAALCEEAGVMSHIGEILFASSSNTPHTITSSNTSTRPAMPSPTTTRQLKNQQSGLSWTREAVDLAEATLVSADPRDQRARDKCSECLAVGMDNWLTMVSKLQKDERRAAAGSPKKASSSWFWGSNARSDEEGRWEREAKTVDERLDSVRRLLSRETDRKERTGGYLFM